jgi:hypothetical protein
MTTSKKATESGSQSSEVTTTRKVRGKRSEKPSLNAEVIQNAKPMATVYYLWDREENGFGVRVTPAGGKAYVVKLLYKGKQVWRTIGKISKREKQPLQPRKPKQAAQGQDSTKQDAELPVIGSRNMTIFQARQIARNLRGDVSKGIDPNEKAQKKNAPTIAGLVERFIEDYVDTDLLGDGSKYGYRRHLNKYIKPGLGDIPIQALGSGKVAELHMSMKNTPRQANQTLAILRKMMNQAEVWELRSPDSNPCLNVKKFPEEPRERFLSHKELAALGEVLDSAVTKHNIPKIAVAAIRLLIHTGARHNEIVKLQWSQVNLERRHLIYSRKQHKTGKLESAKFSR